MNLSTSYISSLERGKRRVSWHVGRQLYECFGISCDSILNAAMAFSTAGVLRETDSDGASRKMNVLLRTCSEEELQVCYSLCSTFLRNTRTQSRAYLRAASQTPRADRENTSRSQTRG